MSAINCDHANECPVSCPCPNTCYCKREGSCKTMIDTGPTEPAFPGQWVDSLPTTGEQVVREQWNGMSLRDYFAAKAMQNFCLSEDISYETAAEMAYRQADAMLRERVRVK